MKSKILTIALCMFCGMSFLSANGAVDAKVEPKEKEAVDETKKEVAAEAELASAEVKKEVKKTAQEEKSCCNCAK
ncbi:MAG TPA: hypothetical protein VMR37_02140 [Rhabdochlamydiaceae bacterium]|jgi:hypothetical protein|nr:hypothetical protein [Rhabdochlamydiaceae bacterium]